MSWTNVSTRLVLAVSITMMMSGCNSEPPVAEAKVRAKPRRTSPSSELPGATTNAPQSASTSESNAPAPTALASTVPIASPTTPAPPILPKVKKVEGAVVENLGPCHGRGIAGEATINGRKEYICGDGSRAYLNDTGYYGKNSKYNSRRRQNTNYGGYSNSNYPPPQRRVVTYVP